jgi:hypothetical protein
MLWYMYHARGWSSVAFLFFVLVHVLTAYALVNLFVAIVMEGFALDADVKLERQVQNYTKYIAKKEEQRGCTTPSHSVDTSHTDKSLRIFAPTNPIRRWSVAIVTHPGYDLAMCILVLYGENLCCP